MVQWLRFHASNAGCMGSIPGQGSSTCHVTKKYKINNRVNKFDIKKKKINTNSQISTTQSYSGFPNCPPSFFIVIFFKHSIMAHTFPLSIIASLVSFAFRISTRFCFKTSTCWGIIPTNADLYTTQSISIGRRLSAALLFLCFLFCLQLGTPLWMAYIFLSHDLLLPITTLTAASPALSTPP